MKKSYILSLLFFITLIFKGNAQGSWAAITSGTTTHLLGVSAPDPGVCYVCGATGTIRKTSNTGVTWVPLSSGTGQNLYSIKFTDALNGYAVGDAGTALRTINGGTTWTPMAVGTSAPLRYVYFFDALTGFIAGGGGLLLKTTDGGTTWNPTTTGTSSLLNSFFFTSSSVGYAAGLAGTAVKTTTAGSSWTGMTSGTSNPLSIVHFPTSSTGVINGDNGTIIRTTTSGASWSVISSGTTDNLTGMDFYDASNGWIVGGNLALNTGTMLQTTDTGATWTLSFPGTSRLMRVDFFDENLGYAVGLDGTILQWTVPPLPDAQFTSSAPGCVNQSENFYSVMSGVSGVTHTWDFGTGAIPATSTSSNPAGVIYSGPGAKTVTHIAATALGADTATNIITINPSPNALFTYSPPSCPGTMLGFNNFGTTGAGITYSWDFGAGASPIVSTAENPSGISYASGGSKIITFNVTNQYGCTTSATQTLTIDSLPPVNAGADTTICFNASIQLGDASMPGISYSWASSTTLSSTVVSNPVASPLAAITHYILTVTNTATGCSNKDTVTISMLPPMFANAGSDAEMCKDDSVQVGTGLIPGQIYSWSPSAGLSDSTLSNPSAAPALTTTYTLTVTGNGCSPASDEVTVTVHNAPAVSAGTDDTITSGSSVQLNATGGILYSWSPSVSLDNSGIYNPVASPAATTTYTVTVTDLYGCSRSDAVTINVIEPAFWVPTAFTPDGNGISDVFFIRGEGILDFEFTIFNRWGEQIFLSKDMMTGWDGTRQSSGDKLPQGAYVYQVKGTLTNGNPVFAKGMINLIR